MTQNEAENSETCSDSFRENEEPPEQGEVLAPQQQQEPASTVTRRSYERKLSISEEAENASSGRLTPPKWLSTIMEYPFRVKNPSTGHALKEATGWSMDAAARGTLNQAGSFVGSTLLILATIDAGCNNPRTCDNEVHGLKPSSLLTFTSAMVAIAAAITMPFIGSLVDHTRHRKSLGVVSAAIVVIITGIQISISRDNWFAILVLEAIGGYFLLVHAAVQFAYLADLTYVEQDLAHYTSRFNLRQYAVQTCYVGLVVLISHVKDAPTPVDKTIQTSRQALSIAFGISFVFMSYAWTFLFRKRPALSKVPEGSNMFTAGFVKVGRTSKKIWSKYRALKWFMISLLWSPEAGSGAFLSIAVTFLTIFLQMTPQQVGIVSLCFLACTIPGSLFSKLICIKFNPLNSYRAALLVFAAVVAATNATLNSPDRKLWAYAFTCGYGFAFGWVYPSQRVLFCTLIPKGQETEMMGLFTFSGQILAWLMPLSFTVMNQNGVSMQWSASVVCWFLLLAALCTIPMGSYREAVAQVANSSKHDDNENNNKADGETTAELYHDKEDSSRIPTEQTQECLEESAV